MAWRVRSFWIAAASVAYVAFAALRSTESGVAAWLALLALPLALAAGWILTAPPSRGEDGIEVGARAAARACMAGCGVFLAARTGGASPAFAAMSNAGAALASMAGIAALARIASPGGVLAPPAASRRLEALAFASLLWTIAVALPAAVALGAARADDLDPVLQGGTTIAASAASLGFGVLSAARLRIRRRFELGVVERAEGALSLLLATLAASALALVADAMPAEQALPLAAIAGGASACWAAVVRDAGAVSRTLRTLVALAALGSPVAVAAVFAGHAYPERAGAIALTAALAASIAGLVVPLAARKLAPSTDRWLRAFDAATRAAMTPDPDLALESALVELRALSPAPRPAGDAPPQASRYDTAALYRLAPAEVITADRAGYVHVDAAEIPARLVELAQLEPEGILRAEVLRSSVVRRPEVRSLLRWLDEHRIGAMALIRDEGGPCGLLSVPRGAPRAAMTLEEARAIRALATRLGAVLGVSASLARSRLREAEARADAALAEARATRLAALLEHDEHRHEEAAAVLARPARGAAYSPAARAAKELLERLADGEGPLTLLGPPGVDVVAWAALAHLASPRHGAPLVVVQGTSAAEHDLLRWRDPLRSPLGLAAGGTLALIDAQGLPADVQRFIAAACPADVRLLVAVPATVGSLAAEGRLDEGLADRIGDRAVALPSLAARAEDLRALALDHLARIGARLRGEPLGLDLRALAALSDHAWPGNDVELAAVLLRAALEAEGPVVGLRELERAGFAPARAASVIPLRDDALPRKKSRRQRS